MEKTERKWKKLQEVLLQYAQNDLCIAFSGGVDSSLLLVLACEAAEKTGKKVYALTMDTVLHPKSDLEIAKKVLAMTNAEHVILKVDELTVPEIRNNPFHRCYLCKKELYSRMLQFAEKNGVLSLLDGSNADDKNVYRPGLQAVKELGVHTPLADAGLTKKEVRLLAERYRLPVAFRPSTPCLATRLPYGAELDVALLEKIGEAEQQIHAWGYENVRVRVHGEIVRLEVDEKDFERMLYHYKKIVTYLKKRGFRYITLDLEGFRSGSMDEIIEKK